LIEFSFSGLEGFFKRLIFIFSGLVIGWFFILFFGYGVAGIER